MKLLIYGNFLLILFFNMQGSNVDSLAESLNNSDCLSKATIYPKHTTPVDHLITVDFRNKVHNFCSTAYKRKELTQLLFEAIAYKNLESDFFQNLIQQGANINFLCGYESDPGRHTLVDRAVILGNNTALLVLLKNGAYMNVPTGYLGQTALHRAFINGDVCAATMLAEHGASEVIMDKNFKTPLDIARTDTQMQSEKINTRKQKKKSRH